MVQVIALATPKQVARKRLDASRLAEATKLRDSAAEVTWIDESETDPRAQLTPENRQRCAYDAFDAWTAKAPTEMRLKPLGERLAAYGKPVHL